MKCLISDFFNLNEWAYLVNIWILNALAADEVTVGALKRLRLDVHQTDRTLKDLLDRVLQVGLGRNLQQKGVNGLHYTTRIMVFKGMANKGTLD